MQTRPVDAPSKLLLQVRNIAKAWEILKPLAPRLRVTARVSSLGMAEVQVVEIYISHRIPEVYALCDRIGVMREGRLAQTIDDTSDLNEDLLMKYASGEVALP
jgi:ABC-type sugar transport system ATPase subunit